MREQIDNKKKNQEHLDKVETKMEKTLKKLYSV